jgi:hypothetical protein
MLARIRDELGESVARIVEHLSDSVVDTTAGDAKAPWVERKVAYLRSLSLKPTESLVVSVADKLQNAESILADFRVEGDELWRRFSMREPKFHLWYYGAIAHILSGALGDHPLAVRLLNTVRALADEVRAGHPDLDAEVAALSEKFDLPASLGELPARVIPRSPTEYDLPCAMCGKIAMIVRIGRAENDKDADKLVVEGVAGTTYVSADGAPLVLAALSAADLARAHQLAAEWVEGGLSGYCPTCDKVYCRDELRLEEQFDDGFYDCTHATCPDGHRRLIDD